LWTDLSPLAIEPWSEDEWDGNQRSIDETYGKPQNKDDESKDEDTDEDGDEDEDEDEDEDTEGSNS